MSGYIQKRLLTNKLNNYLRRRLKKEIKSVIDNLLENGVSYNKHKLVSRLKQTQKLIVRGISVSHPDLFDSNIETTQYVARYFALNTEVAVHNYLLKKGFRQISENDIYPTGMGGEKNDWIPVIKINGKVFYKPEKGDSPETLQSQFGLPKKQAEDLYYNHRNWDGAIAGESVEAVTGNEILRLNTFSDKQRNLEHIMFAMLYSKINRTQIENKTVMKVQDFFELSKKTMAFEIEGNGTVNINGKNISILVCMPVKTTMKGWYSNEIDYYYAFSVRINNNYDRRSDNERDKYPFDNSYFGKYFYVPDGNPKLQTNYYSYIIFSTPKSQTQYFINQFK